MSEEKKIKLYSKEEKYPVESTKYPTPFDDAIAQKTAWLKENRPGSWEMAQSAPSELCFKIHMLGYVHANYGEELQEFIDGKREKMPSSFEIQKELFKHPDTSLEDLEWRLALAKALNSPAVIKLTNKIAKFKEEHGITDQHRI